MDSRNISNDEKLKQTESKVSLGNLKSDFFIIKIFGYMEKNKVLNIMKYNKKLQNLFKFTISNYKEFSQIYSSIEIELNLIDNPKEKFINISEKNKEYYHIYFNNSKVEIKRNYLNESEKVNIIKIKIDYQVKSFEKMFENCSCISSIYFKKFRRINITNMSWMFCGCKSLKELNLTNFNTDNVTDMSCMFFECTSLKELNLSNFNTNNVIYMSAMFYGCSSLKKLDLTNFNTNNVTYMSGMFGDCKSLNELIISNFNTDNVIDMSSIFKGCKSLKELELSNFNNKNARDIYHMFFGCSDELIEKIKAKYKNIRI